MFFKKNEEYVNMLTIHFLWSGNLSTNTGDNVSREGGFLPLTSTRTTSASHL